MYINMQSVEAWLGFFVLVAVAINWLWKGTGFVSKPIDNLKSRVKDNKTHIEKLEVEVTDIIDRLDQNDKQTKLIMGAMVSLLGHAIDGNQFDKMKQSREELIDYLVNR